MNTIVFADTLQVPEDAEVLTHKRPTPDTIRKLARNAAGPVYLCGGGDFAGWMLKHDLIDRLILKHAPTVLRCGTPLFGTNARPVGMSRVQTKTYENGYLLEEFEVWSACRERHSG